MKRVADTCADRPCRIAAAIVGNEGGRKDVLRPAFLPLHDHKLGTCYRRAGPWLRTTASIRERDNRATQFGVLAPHDRILQCSTRFPAHSSSLHASAFNRSGPTTPCHFTPSAIDQRPIFAIETGWSLALSSGWPRLARLPVLACVPWKSREAASSTRSSVMRSSVMRQQRFGASPSYPTGATNPWRKRFAMRTWRSLSRNIFPVTESAIHGQSLRYPQTQIKWLSKSSLRTARKEVGIPPAPQGLMSG